MTLKELNSKIIDKVESKVGIMQEITDFEADTLLSDDPTDFFGKFKTVGGVILSIYFEVMDGYPYYALATVRTENEDIEYYCDLITDDPVNAVDDIYTADDLDHAIKQVDRIIDAVLLEER